MAASSALSLEEEEDEGIEMPVECMARLCRGVTAKAIEQPLQDGEQR